MSESAVARLVLESFEERRRSRRPWKSWLQRVVRAFGGAPPDHLLEDLKGRGVAELADLVDAYQHKRQRRLREVQEDYDKWIERRDEGNRRAARKRREELQEAKRLKERAETENARKEWAPRLAELTRQRELQLI